MHPVLRDGEYVYVLWPHGRPLDGASRLPSARPRASRWSCPGPKRTPGPALRLRGGLDHPGGPLGTGSCGPDCRRQQGADRCQDQLQRAGRLPPRPSAGARGRRAAGPGSPAELSAASRDRAAARAGAPQRDGPADRDAILALTAEAFAVSPVTGLPVEGEPVEVEVLRAALRLRGIPAGFSVVAELDGEIVGHVISTRGWVEDSSCWGSGPSV